MINLFHQKLSLCPFGCWSMFIHFILNFMKSFAVLLFEIWTSLYIFPFSSIPLSCSCEEDVNECERSNPEGECENGGICVNTHGSFYCNCTAGFVGQRCSLRPVVVPDMQAGHDVVGKEELIGITVVLLVIITLIILFIAFRKKVFQKNYSRNNLSLVQDPATAALLNKTNGTKFKTLHCTPGDPLNLFSETGLGPTVMGPPQVPIRPMAYTPCFQGDPRSTLEKMADERDAEHTEMSTFHSESPRILAGTSRRGVVVCSVAPNLPPGSPCYSECDSIHKSPWDSDEGEFVCVLPVKRRE